MKRYFVPNNKCDMTDLQQLPLLSLDEQQLFLPETQTKPEAVVTMGESSYRLTREIARENVTVIGYIEVKSREKTERFRHKDAIGVIASGSTVVMVTANPHGNVVGYLHTQENEYLAVTEQHRIILFVPIALVSLLVMVSVYFFWTPTIPPDAVIDAPVDGGLTPTISEQLDPAYFNLKVNATPILKEGTMNIRIENSARNQYDCYAEVEMMQGGKAETIYRSPMIQPNQTLEKATLTGQYPSGVYDGKAYFSFYDDDKLIGKAAVKLIINVRS